MTRSPTRAAVSGGIAAPDDPLPCCAHTTLGSVRINAAAAYLSSFSMPVLYGSRAGLHERVATYVGRRLHEVGHEHAGLCDVLAPGVLVERRLAVPFLDEAELARVGGALQEIVLITGQL